MKNDYEDTRTTGASPTSRDQSWSALEALHGRVSTTNFDSFSKEFFIHICIR